jgi:hypothetical protein
MSKHRTHFEQVPLAIAQKIAADEAKRKEAGLKDLASKRKSGGEAATAVVARMGASL